jgi:two-component system alkaline phosphatase synthesis response regulator PhoP
MKTRILLIEDDAGLVLTISDRLSAEGYDVQTALDGVAGLSQAQTNTADVIVLDVMLPKKNGFDVCRDLRASGITTPVLMLTARGQVTDKVVGLKLGADDYLTKPFDMLELLARIEALLRRVALAEADGRTLASQHDFMFGDVTVNVQSMEVRRSGGLLDLSAKEFQLLVYLLEHRGRMLTREDMLNNVWGYDAMPTTRTVDTHIAWLRQKLEPNPKYPQYILTAHGIGYKFVG